MMRATPVAYLASPIDLIPDIIPILGMLDDLAVAALALWLAYRLTPRHVMEECRTKAQAADAGRPGWISILWRKLNGEGDR